MVKKKLILLFLLLILSFLPVTFIKALIQANMADANGPYVGDEGSSIVFDASGSYSEVFDIVLYEWDWDIDGVYDSSTIIPTTTHTWGNAFSGIAALRVTDSNGGTDTDTCSVTVYNVPPTTDAGPYQTVDEGDTVHFSGSFTDPGWLDTHAATWDWGDGSPSMPGTVVEENVQPDSTGTVSGSHVYGQAGVYTVSLFVMDDEGGIGTDTCSVTVNLEEIHDVEAVSQIATVTSVEPGTMVDIKVQVRNNGGFDETFDVTCYYDGVPIGTQTTTLSPHGDAVTLIFTWDTTGVPLNEYLITAWADSGEAIDEVDEPNNWCDRELPIFVVPELPLGTVMALASMLAAMTLFRKRPSIKI